MNLKRGSELHGVGGTWHGNSSFPNLPLGTPKVPYQYRPKKRGLATPYLNADAPQGVPGACGCMGGMAFLEGLEEGAMGSTFTQGLPKVP